MELNDVKAIAESPRSSVFRINQAVGDSRDAEYAQCGPLNNIAPHVHLRGTGHTLVGDEAHTEGKYPGDDQFP